MYTQTHIHVHRDTYAHSQSTHIHIQTDTHTYTYKQTHMHTYTDTYAHTNMHMHEETHTPFKKPVKRRTHVRHILHISLVAGTLLGKEATGSLLGQELEARSLDGPNTKTLNDERPCLSTR